MELKNYMEIIVNEAIDKLADIKGACRCDICRLDTACFALNNLAPKYVVTEKGEMYTKANELRQQFQVDVDVAVLKAIELVAKKPRH